MSLEEKAAEMGERCNGSKEVHRALTWLARHGISKLGRFTRSFEVDHATALGTQPGDTSNLLPIHPAAAESLFSEWLHLVNAECQESLVELSLGVVLGFIFYACAGFASTPVDASVSMKLTSSQRQCCWKLFWDSKNFLETPSRPFELQSEKKELRERRMTYSGESVTVREDLKVHLVEPAWPKARGGLRSQG